MVHFLLSNISIHEADKQKSFKRTRKLGYYSKKRRNLAISRNRNKRLIDRSREVLTVPPRPPREILLKRWPSVMAAMLFRDGYQSRMGCLILNFMSTNKQKVFLSKCNSEPFVPFKHRQKVGEELIVTLSGLIVNFWRWAILYDRVQVNYHVFPKLCNSFHIDP